MITETGCGRLQFDSIARGAGLLNISPDAVSQSDASPGEQRMQSTTKNATGHSPFPRYLIRHLGNMGDMVFLVPPALETLKRRHPNCHITLVTAWGFKSQKRKYLVGPKQTKWGPRNQSGFCIHLLMTNPNIDQLVHYHTSKLDLEGNTCQEDGQSFPTWSESYYQQQKDSGLYDGIFELDFGIGHEENPIKKMYQYMNMPEEDYSNYKVYLSPSDLDVASQIIKNYPRPRIVLLEGLEGKTTRGWDPSKVSQLESAIKAKYKVSPIYFGSKHVPNYKGAPLTLRQNIATLSLCDIAIGVMSGPLHFAASVGLPTITLFCDQPLHRAAPAYFLNQYIKDKGKHHRTILGPDCPPYEFLKSNHAPRCITPAEDKIQSYQDWQSPGNQSTKSCLAPISVNEVMQVLNQNM